MLGKFLLGSVLGVLGGYALLEMGAEFNVVAMNIPGIPRTYEILALSAAAGATLGLMLGALDR